MALQHLRSSTANKRPIPSVMSAGQLAVNTNEASPGLFFKDSNGDLVKVGPVHIGANAPNSSPDSVAATALVTGTVYQILVVGTSDFTLVGASANTVGTVFTATGTTTGTGTVSGQQGNEKGEMWLDNTGGSYVFKIYDGTAWRSEAGEFVNVTGDTMTGDLVFNNADIVFEGSTADAFETTLTVVDPTADRTITLPNVTGTVVTTGDTGSVTSTMITDGTIVNADVNASAAIAGTKVSPDFGSQAITTTGIINANGKVSFPLGAAALPSLYPGSDTDTGIYSPGANQLAISTNGTERLFVAAGGDVGIGTSDPQDTLSIGESNGTGSLTLFSATTAEEDVYGKILFRHGTASGNRNAKIEALRSGGSSGGDLAFYTRKQADGVNTDGGLERMRIDSDGNVGIGTSSPEEKLQVNGTILTETVTYTANQDQPYLIAGTTLYTGANTNWGTYGFQHRFKSNGSGAPRITIDSVNGELFCVDNNGNVGIGTSSPSSLLHLAANAPYITFEDKDNNQDWQLQATAWFALRNQTTSSELVRVTAAGNVGIGQSSPARNLHIKSSVPGLRLEDTDWNGYHDIGDNANGDLLINANASSTSGITSDIRFQVGTSEKLRITSTGNVGIGNSDPEAKLTVGDFNTSSIIRMRAQAPGVNGLDFGDAADPDIGRIRYSHSDDALAFTTNATEKLRITSGGNVGIGTTNPSTFAGDCTLALYDSGGARIGIGATGRTYYIGGDSGSDRLEIGRRITGNTADSPGIVLASTGNVGIGTSAPGSKLTVNGTIAASSLSVSGDQKLALNVNDGHGNSNLVFNDISGIANINGSCARISSTTDTSTGSLTFQVGNNSVAGSANTKTTVLSLTTSGAAIAGSLSKSSGSFKIDHPLPALSETHDLVHSFVEAPDASNLYAGMVDLVDGTATVNIDTAHRMTEGTFEALNSLQSWSSSNESGYAPVKCSVSGNLLTIECQDATSTDTVYYEVRGVRKDPHMLAAEWTDSNGLVIVEPEKIVESEE